MIEEKDISSCKVCGCSVARIFKGYYPDGKNKRFVDETDSLWVGRKCPTCVRTQAKIHIKKVRSLEYVPKATKLTNSYITVSKEYNAAYYKKNKEILKQKRKEQYYKAREMSARRRAQIKMATPTLISKKDRLELQKIYKNCPEGYHVDHIVPLQGKEVCGLHVPWNLQYLPASENISKGNRI